MMKIEEALEIISRKSTIPNEGESFADIETACDMAVKALLKQIPEKPIKCSETKMWYSACFVCRSCGGGFSGTGIAKYCYHCGQALDWSENNS